MQNCVQISFGHKGASMSKELMQKHINFPCECKLQKWIGMEVHFNNNVSIKQWHDKYRGIGTDLA